jgi:hypothetical protein
MPFPTPFTTGVKHRQWDIWTQPWAALRDIHTAVGMSETGARTYPEGTYVFAQGRIRTATAAAGDTVDLVCEDYGGTLFAWTAVFNGGAYDEWVDYDGAVDWRREFQAMDVCLETCDPRECFRVNLTAQPDETTIRAAVTAHLRVEHNIAVADLEGRLFKIVRRGGTGYFERWPEWSNATIYATGKVSAATTTTLTDPRKRWAAGTYATGKEVMFFGQDGTLYRKPISGASGQTLTFTAAASAPQLSQPYYVINAGGLFRWSAPDAVLPRPFAQRTWYSGAMDNRIVHLPDDTRGPRGLIPTASMTISRGEVFGFCADEVVLLADKDPWIPPQEQPCAGGHADTRLNPNVTKTLRWIQKYLESVAGYFLDPGVTWDGAAAIYHFRRATLFEAANVGLPQRATISSIDGAGLHVTLSCPYTPVGVYVTAVETDGTVLPLTSLGEDDLYLEYDGSKFAGTFEAGLAGKTLVASFGWKRRHPWWIERLFDVSVWVPADDGAGGVVVPPTSADPGQYVTYPASQKYMEPQDGGLIVESSDANYNFVDGRLARLVGDNWHTPIADTLAEVAETEYRERWFAGTRGPVAQKKMNAALSGRATAIADNRHFSDTSKNWYDVDFFAGGVLITHTGTANDGSTTTLIDTTMAGDGFWTDPNRFQDMVAEVNDGLGNWYKRVITAHSGPLQRLTFNYALPFSASGKAYKIREPNSVRARFKGLPVYLTGKNAGGAVIRETATVEGHDDISLFVTPATAIVGDLSYRIGLPAYGGVHRYDSGTGKHLPVTGGTDPRAGGIANFHRNPRENLPEFATRYGCARHGDYLFTDNLTEVAAVIGLLSVTEISANPENPDSDEFTKSAGRGGSTYNGSWATVWGNTATDFAGAIGSFDTGLPEAWGRGSESGPNILDPVSGDEFRSTFTKRVITRFYASGIAQGDCPLVRSVKIYVFAQVDATGTDNAGVYHAQGHADGESFCWSPGGGSTTVNWEEYLFDDNGDPVKYRAWSEVAELFPGDNEDNALMGSPVGATLSMPAAPPQPTPGGCYTGAAAGVRGSKLSYKGYVGTAATSLIFWEMPLA